MCRGVHVTRIASCWEYDGALDLSVEPIRWRPGAMQTAATRSRAAAFAAPQEGEA